MLPVMIHKLVRTLPYGANKIYVFAIMEAEDEDWDPLKLA